MKYNLPKKAFEVALGIAAIGFYAAIACAYASKISEDAKSLRKFQPATYINIGNPPDDDFYFCEEIL